MQKKLTQRNIILCLIAVGLAVFGLLMQYSASSYNALRETGDSFFYVKKQSIALIVGLVAMLGAYNIKTDFYKKFRIYILIGSYILLAVLFIPGVGIEKYGACRWINLGVTTLQPSEVAKFGLMIFIAACLAKKSSKTFKGMIVPILATAFMCVLIMLEPNMSITMLVALSMLVMLFVGGARFKYFCIMGAPLLIGVIVLIVIEPYRMERLLAFIDPWASPQDEGFQLIQSYYALSSGGLFGVGLFNSRQKYAFLPFAESDFIFAIIGEELGIFGCVILMCVFVLLIIYGIRAAMAAHNPFNSYLASGVTAIIALQTVLNMMVVTGTIPPTGLPLPFISAGGSSLVVFMFAVGILMRVNRESALNSSLPLMRNYVGVVREGVKKRGISSRKA